jgi:hypothetical protein
MITLLKCDECGKVIPLEEEGCIQISYMQPPESSNAKRSEHYHYHSCWPLKAAKLIEQKKSDDREIADQVEWHRESLEKADHCQTTKK